MSTVLEPRSDLDRLSAVDEPLYEIVDGQRVDLPPMSIFSNVVAARLYVAILELLKSSPLGTVVVEALLILDEETNLRRRPDVAFISAERWPLERDIPETGDWSVVPDLAIEVTSPHDLYADVVGKVHEYFDHGVREVWVVELEHRVVSVHRSAVESQTISGDQVLTTTLLPGLTIPLSEVFSRRPLAAR